MKEQWKKEMQQKMADYQESDIEVSWAEIEKVLAANRKQAKVVPLWLRHAAAAAVILLLAGGGYWTVFHHQTGVEEQAEQPHLAHVPQKESQEPEVMQELQEKIIQKVKAQGLLSLFTAVNDTEPDTLYASTDAETVMPTEEVATKETSSLTDTLVLPRSTPHHQQYTVYPSDLRKRASSFTRLTAKVYLSNTMASSSNFSSSIFQEKITNPPIEQPGDPGGKDGKDGSGGKDGKDGSENMTPIYKTVLTSESIHHHQPIRFGLSLRYRLNERWGLESGLTYTRLSADITNTVDGQATATEQSLNYIGIPLNVSYLVWGNRHFNLYLSAGGLVEKMVKGSRTTYDETNSVNIHPLQVSVNGAAGAEFKFCNDFSLYLEPALNYYFDNGSSIPTLYQEKPLNFNLNVGIRFNLK